MAYGTTATRPFAQQAAGTIQRAPNQQQGTQAGNMRSLSFPSTQAPSGNSYQRVPGQLPQSAYGPGALAPADIQRAPLPPITPANRWGLLPATAGQSTGGGGAGSPGGGSQYGTHSGPGILEQWFNQRASGTDPAYEYGMGRGMDAIDTRMAAGGSFNSGARGQQLSDFAANMGAQRMGQLDSLAGGASGEHRDRVNSMFAQGMGLAGGQAGLAGQYDIGASNAMSAANQAIMMMMLNKAGVDSQADQNLINNIFKGIGLSQGLG